MTKMSLESLISTKERYNSTLIDINYGKLKLIVPIIALIVIILSGCYEVREFQYNIDTYDRFICKSTINGGFTVVVDKKDGWILKDNHFIKGNSTIFAKRCTPAEELSDE
jgi:hypothetical protein